MVSSPASSIRRASPDSWLELVWALYRKQLRKKPLRTKALTSAAVMSLSDLISQRIGGRPFSFKRNLIVAVWGLMWGGPSGHFWQSWMEKVSSGKDMHTVLMKVLIDQLTFGPINNLMNMAFFTLLVENKGLAHLLGKIANEYPSIQLNGWKVWPAAAMFNYRFVPLNFRVLFLNFIALGWTTFLNVSATTVRKVE